MPTTAPQLREAAAVLTNLVEQYRLLTSRRPADEVVATMLRDTAQERLVEALTPCAAADLSTAGQQWLQELLIAAQDRQCSWGLIEDDAIMLTGDLKLAAERAEQHRALKTGRIQVSAPIDAARRTPTQGQPPSKLRD